MQRKHDVIGAWDIFLIAHALVTVSTRYPDNGQQEKKCWNQFSVKAIRLIFVSKAQQQDRFFYGWSPIWEKVTWLELKNSQTTRIITGITMQKISKFCNVPKVPETLNLYNITLSIKTAVNIMKTTSQYFIFLRLVVTALVGVIKRTTQE